MQDIRLIKTKIMIKASPVKFMMMCSVWKSAVICTAISDYIIKHFH